MGDMADMINEDFGCLEYQDSIEGLLELDDKHLKEYTAKSRDKKIMSIRKWPKPLSPKQRYCLAAWIHHHE